MEVNFSADTGCSYGLAGHKKNTHESNYKLHLLPLLLEYSLDIAKFNSV